MLGNGGRIENRLFEAIFWALFVSSVATAIFGVYFGIFWLGPFGVVASLIGIWSGFLEPRLIVVKAFRQPLVSEPKTWIRLVFLSDFHAGLAKPASFYDRVVEKSLSLRPDIVILGGDFVEARASAMDDLHALKKLQAPLGVHFLLGNHDFLENPEFIRETLLNWDVTDATNRSWLVEKGVGSLEVVALEDAYFGTPDLALLEQSASFPRLLILHEPDQLLDVEKGDADLILLGHTHGGQVRLPGIGAIGPMPQIVSRKYDRGVKDWRGIPVIIGQGVGESTARVRLCCPPQILLIEIGLG